MFYVVRTVRLGMKLYNDQRNAQDFNLFINLLLPYMFRVWCQLPGADTILNLCRSFTPASEDGLIEGPKHVRQK
jgi:hypothetical protein